MVFVKHKIFAFLIISFFVVSVVNAQDNDAASLESGLILKVINKMVLNEGKQSQIKVIKNINNEFKFLSPVEQMMMRIHMRDPDIVPSEIQSSFFTFNELQLLRQARRGLATKTPTKEEVFNSQEVELTSLAPGPRNINLSGILYLSKKDWTIWLNNEEVNPNTIPSAVMDLTVNKEYIEIEWFDSLTNQIYPIRLRSNQMFNLDARLFLPGD